jgi:hypothetical protein
MEGEGETHTKVSKRSVSCIGTPWKKKIR